MTKPFDEKKFLNITRFMKNISKIIMILMSVVFGIIVIMFGVTVFVPTDTLTVDLSRMDEINIVLFNTNIVYPTSIFEGMFMVKNVLLALLGFTLVAVGFFYLILRLIYQVLSDVYEKVPFSQQNVKRLYYLSYTLMAMAIVLPLFMLLVSWQTIHALELDATANYSIEANTLFTGILVWILASIFNYGKYLQDEVDQTV